MTDIFILVEQYSNPTLYKAEGVKETEKQYDLRPAKITRLIGPAFLYASIVAKGRAYGYLTLTDGSDALEEYRRAVEAALTRAKEEVESLEARLYRVDEITGVIESVKSQM